VLKPASGWSLLLLRVLIANGVMAALLWWLAGDTLRWTAMPFIERLWRGTGGILLGAVVYFAVLFLLGMRQHHLRSARA
jgi:putative peptidoglycan lipid II flippase